MSSAITWCLHKIATLCVNWPFSQSLIIGNLHWFVLFKWWQFRPAPRERSATFVTLHFCITVMIIATLSGFITQSAKKLIICQYLALSWDYSSCFSVIPSLCRTISRSAGTTSAPWSVRTWCFSIKWRRLSLRYTFWLFVAFLLLFCALCVSFEALNSSRTQWERERERERERVCVCVWVHAQVLSTALSGSVLCHSDCCRVFSGVPVYSWGWKVRHWRPERILPKVLLAACGWVSCCWL